MRALTSSLLRAVYGLEALAGLVGVERLVELSEARVNGLQQRRVALLEGGAQRGDGLLAALEVGVEVPEVGVAVALLLAGDLAGGHLVEQRLGAVRDWSGLSSTVLALADHLLDVGQQLVGDRAAVLLQAVLPQVLLEAVIAGERHALVHDLLAAVDLGVEVTEGLRHGLDLSHGPRASDTGLGLGHLPGLDRGRELRGVLEELVGLVRDVLLVPVTAAASFSSEPAAPVAGRTR